MKFKALIIIFVGLVLIISGLVINISKSDSNGVSEKKDINHSTQLEIEPDMSQAIFMELIAGKFSKKYFTISRLYNENKFGNSDLKVEYNIKETKGTFYLKITWLQDIKKKNIDISNESEIEDLKKHFQGSSEPIFKIIGIGGKQSKPNSIYIISLSANSKGKLDIEKMETMKKKDANSNFYFNAVDKLLK